MPAPTVINQWASNDVVETDPQEGGSVNNKEQPNTALTNTGALNTRALTRPHLNYMLDSHSKWTSWLREGEVGDRKFVDPAVDVAEMVDRFGGDWDDLGTTIFMMTPGPDVTFRVFERIT
jgi:hypothetical protein